MVLRAEIVKKDIIKDEVITQLPQILPKEVSDFATSVIQSTINKSLENVILAKSSSQPKSTYEAAESLIEFELKKILLDKMEKMLSRISNHEDEDKDEDPPVGSNQSLEKEGEPVFEAADTEMQQDQGIEFGHTVDKPDGEASLKSDWLQRKPKQASNLVVLGIKLLYLFTLDRSAWNHNIAKRPALKLSQSSCQKVSLNLTFHFEECYKVLTDRIDWNYPEGHEYPFDLSKTLPLIKVQGRQVVPTDYFFNNDLEYLKGGSSSRKCTTSTTKTKAAKYDNIEGIEDMVPKL
ncbi:hypothetical protein Tco_1020256 [Tanacetum coccineum]|uniref:Uncharacterized protein n=1 Tax=Tanacetum coccineum TaxID=301880 RepID=A0ABQ5FZH8_9ASTR